MNSLKVKIIWATNDAEGKDIRIGVNLTSEKAKFTIGSHHLDYKADISLDESSSDAKFDFKKYSDHPKVEKREKDRSIKYIEDENKFVGNYHFKYEIDILTINSTVKNILRSKASNSKLYSDKKELEKQLKGSLSIIKRRSYLKKYNMILEKLKNSDSALDRYLERIKMILNDYEIMKSNYSRGILVNRYLEIAQEYVKFDLYQQHTNYNICIGCRETLNTQINSVNGIICSKCNTLNSGMNKITIETEKSYQSSGKKGKNENNFIKNFTRAMCLQKVSLPSNLESKLDDYFERKSGIIGSKYKEIPLVRSGVKKIREGTSIKKMVSALEATGNNALYLHVKYICVLYWGWEVDDLTYALSEIMIRYRITSNIYNTIKKGSSNLKADYHLYRILVSMGIDYCLDDFKPIKVKDTLEDYEEYWQKIENMILSDHSYQYHNGEKIDWRINK